VECGGSTPPSNGSGRNFNRLIELVVKKMVCKDTIFARSTPSANQFVWHTSEGSVKPEHSKAPNGPGDPSYEMCFQQPGCSAAAGLLSMSDCSVSAIGHEMSTGDIRGLVGGQE
jgi:hypothetical protein